MRCEADMKEDKMKRRFLAFVCCFSMLVSLLPCSAKANGRTTNVNLLDLSMLVKEKGIEVPFMKVGSANK